ncbi:MAG: hypothetical protein H0X43_14055 [Nitrosospira sp.]|nr:hypothetical protein [Nitrosospira sp.]
MKWQFAPRFRRHAFGWRSNTPIQRIKEAVSEIRQAGRNDPVVAAEGAVLLLEKLSPALENVDSSSGALGTAVNRVIDTLVTVIAKPTVDLPVRQRWLERLWIAIEKDDMPYIEVLGDYWGELCVTTELASGWADKFQPLVLESWGTQASNHSFFKGTSACLASLYAAGRYEQLLSLLDSARLKWWDDRRWGIKTLVAMGKKAEALRYAENSRDLNAPGSDIARHCEEILLSSGLMDDAYRRYALEANRGTTNLATFRTIARKYPRKPQAEILRDLIASQPGAEGKWFAAAKEAGLFDLAVELASRSPVDPRTLARAARDYSADRPEFAVASGLAALHWISLGHGYEITGLDAHNVYTVVMEAAHRAGMDEHDIKEQVLAMISGSQPSSKFLKTILADRLAY